MFTTRITRSQDSKIHSNQLNSTNLPTLLALFLYLTELMVSFTINDVGPKLLRSCVSFSPANIKIQLQAQCDQNNRNRANVRIPFMKLPPHPHPSTSHSCSFEFLHNMSGTFRGTENNTYSGKKTKT